MDRSGIYIIKSKINPDRFYIGSASYLESRKRTHFSALNLNKHHSIQLQRHYNKYGKEDLVFEIIEYVRRNRLKLIEREQYWLDELNPYFNTNKIANSNLGIKMSEVTKKKISESKIGIPSLIKGIAKSEETKKKMSVAKKGKYTGKQSNFYGIKLYGEDNPFFGKTHSDETKKKISIASSGRKHTGESKRKMSESRKGQIPWNIGVKQSEEWLRKRVESRNRTLLLNKTVESLL